MSLYHSLKKVEEFAHQAWGIIQKQGLSPTPDNFELWFVYYSNTEPGLVSELNVLRKQDDLSDSSCYELFKKYLKNEREDEAVLEAGDKIKETISTVNNAVSGAREFAHEYNASLEEINEELHKEKSKKEIDALLNSLLSDTRTMMDQNVYFETLLQKSADTMEELQRDLVNARKEALTDQLTGLMNRKGFDHEIETVVSEAKEEGHEVFVLILVDIDHFKKFNDTYGHQLGDQVIKLVARTLKSSVKGRDKAARYGGEEFAIILPETRLFGGLKVGEFLRQQVGGKDVVNRLTGERLSRVTISAGVAEFDRTESIESVIARADAALYAAKENGRNQVASATKYNGEKKDAC